MSFLEKILEKRPWLKKIYETGYIFSERMEKHHIFILAAGIAFNIIIYLIPLFLVAIYVINLFLSEGEISKYIQSIFSEWLPPTDQAHEILRRILAEVQQIEEHSSIFGIVGIGVLLWISSFLVSSLRTGLNSVFQLHSQKIFIIYRIKDIILTILLSILVVIYSYAMPLVNFVEDFLTNFFPSTLENFVSDIILMLISAATSFVVFYIIYALVPNKKLPRFVVLLSTSLCVVAIEVSRRIFAWYIGELSNYGKFYGTYAVIVSHAIWIYYSSLIILFSAEISKFIYDKKHGKVEKLEDFLEERKD